MTLLFATFVVLYGLKSEGETQELRGVVSAIRESFVEVPDQIEEPDTGPVGKGKIVFKNRSFDAKRLRQIKKFHRNRNYVNKIEADLLKLRKTLEAATDKKIRPYFKKESRNISVFREGHTLVVSLDASMTYEKNSYRLSSKQLILLKPVASFLEKFDKDIIIESYAINNLKLASLRATFLVKLLSREYRVPLRRLRPFGIEYAEKSNEQGRKLPDMGQRVDIKIVYE